MAKTSHHYFYLHPKNTRSPVPQQQPALCGVQSKRRGRGGWAKVWEGSAELQDLQTSCCRGDPPLDKTVPVPNEFKA